jgi:UDP-glucose 4-epimerase
MNSKKVLVSGGAGFIGSHLVEKLLETGCKVIVYDNFSYGSMENLSCVASNNLQVVEGDVTDLESLRSAAKNVDQLFHLAVLNLRVGLEDPLSAFEVNVRGTLNICIIAKENRKIQRTIFTSSGAVYGRAMYFPRDEKHPLDATNPYAADKVAGEMYLRAFHESWKIPYVILRLFNTYGPRSQQTAYAEVIPRFVDRITSGLPPIIFGTGKQRMDFTHVTDIVDGIVRAAESNEALNNIMNLASGQDVSINELADILLKILGKKGEIEPVYAEPRPHEIPVYQEVPSPIVSISKAERLVGYKPLMPFEVGVEEYIEHCQLKKTC